ncbi:MAG: hypothetical protein IKC46_07005 [Lachnospiraceae bacterium]|nr:hypothetical protein [Lachnospiraceae bacterium]
MENRMLLVQALDERDLLVKKIMDRTEDAQFVDCRKPRAVNGWKSRLPLDVFEKEAKRQLQQIQDLIRRYDRINEAITICNASTMIDTSRGRMPLSCVITLRNRLRGNGPYGSAGDFEGALIRRIRTAYQDMQESLDDINGLSEGKARQQAQLCDPLHILGRAQRIGEEKEALLMELEMKIKVANATTYLNVE